MSGDIPYIVRDLREGGAIRQCGDHSNEAFYQTDTGRKTIEKMPELMAKGTQLGVKRVQDNLDELQAMIKAEADRLTESQGQQ